MTTIRCLPVIVIAFVVAGCGGGVEPPVDGAVDEPDATTAAAPDPEPQPTASTSPETTVVPVPPESLPGEQIDFGPLPGDRVAVVGVPFDDVLNVRIGPGTEFDVVDQLVPETTDVLATGANRLRDDSFWIEVELEGRTGWVSERYIGFLGVAEEHRVAPGVGREDMTIEELGAAVADTFTSQDPPSEIVQVSPVVDGAVVFDVIGLGDDAVKGVRLTVDTGPSGSGRQVTGVSVQPICGRGLTADGLCI